jgi:PAS domain S-box-containing protein
VWETIQEWTTPAHILAALLVALATIVGFIKPIWRWTKALIGDVVFLFQQRRAHEEIGAQLQAILDEVKPNDGGSLADAIRRTERKVDFLGARHLADLNSAQAAIVETDERGKVIWVNRAYVKLLGTSLSTVEGDGWINVIAPECRDRIEALWARTVEARRALDEDIAYINADGHTFVAHVIAHPIVSDRGEFHGYLAEIVPYDDDEFNT